MFSPCLRHARIIGPACVAVLLAWTAGGASAQDPDGGTMKFRVTRRLDQGPPPGDPPKGRGVAFAAIPGDASWTLKVGRLGEVIIAYEGVEVVRSGYQFASQKDADADGQIALVGRSPQQVEFQAAVPDLGLQWRGWALPFSPRELRVELDITASRALTEIAGGGLTWILKTDASGLRGKAGPPVLLDDRTGWRWPVGEGREVAVRFDRPIARLFSEPAQPGRGGVEVIRTSFVGDRIRTGRGRIGLTVTLPEGGRVVASDEERYAPPEKTWFRDALRKDAAPVDLSYLNADDRPAGRRGAVRADGDRLVFADGTPGRFWGANLSGLTIFAMPREDVPAQARRLARFGFNLVRLHQLDAGPGRPSLFAGDSGRLDPRSLDLLDLWVKCLKDEGIYVWLDLHDLRELRPADAMTRGRDEVARQRNLIRAFNYLDPELADLMKGFQHQLLDHVNRYTGLAYKDDPALLGVLVTNENDLTGRAGWNVLADSNHPIHRGLLERELNAFAQSSGLPRDQLGRLGEPGPSRYLLADVEGRFFRAMIDDLRSQGVRAPIAATSLFGQAGLDALPPLTEGDLIDAHVSGASEALSTNPRDTAHFLGQAALAQVVGKPLTISEWSMPPIEFDRFTAPLFVASIASLQGWDALMVSSDIQIVLKQPGTDEERRRVEGISTSGDPALLGVLPAAALAFRRGHVAPARKSYCLALPPDRLFGGGIRPENSAALRTLMEQSRLTIGMPAVKELPWLRAAGPPAGATAFSDPQQDFLPAGAAEIRSDTGELSRNWRQGIQTIDTPRTQAVAGWIGGKTLALKDAAFEFQTRKATVAVTSIDDQPLASSRFLLITAVAQARLQASTNPDGAGGEGAGELHFLSEPVVGTIRLRNPTAGLELLSMGPDGRVLERSAPERQQDALTIKLPAGRGTHWYILRTRQLTRSSKTPSGSTTP